MNYTKDHSIFYCFRLFLVITSTARTLLCPCQNGGVCSMPGSQICSCSDGFTGRFCENLLRKYNELIFPFFKYFLIILAAGDCRQIHCSNGGTCFENSPGSSGLAHCKCKSGYTGKLCEIG